MSRGGAGRRGAEALNAEALGAEALDAEARQSSPKRAEDAEGRRHTPDVARRGCPPSSTVVVGVVGVGAVALWSYWNANPAVLGNYGRAVFSEISETRWALPCLRVQRSFPARQRLACSAPRSFFALSASAPQRFSAFACSAPSNCKNVSTVSVERSCGLPPELRHTKLPCSPKPSILRTYVLRSGQKSHHRTGARRF